MYIADSAMFPIFQIPTIELGPFIQFYMQVERSGRDPLMILPIPARTSPMIEFVFGDRFKVRYPESRDEVATPATAPGRHVDASARHALAPGHVSVFRNYVSG